jgi:pilus assembly protein Flp/PilA
MFLKKKRRQTGAALVEYGLLVAGVALVATAAVAIFGSKTSDLIASVATVLPGAHTTDNGPITSGKIVETTPGQDTGSSDPITVDVTAILENSGETRLGDNLGLPVQSLVLGTQ